MPSYDWSDHKSGYGVIIAILKWSGGANQEKLKGTTVTFLGNDVDSINYDDQVLNQKDEDYVQFMLLMEKALAYWTRKSTISVAAFILMLRCWSWMNVLILFYISKMHSLLSQEVLPVHFGIIRFLLLRRSSRTNKFCILTQPLLMLRLDLDRSNETIQKRLKFFLHNYSLHNCLLLNSSLLLQTSKDLNHTKNCVHLCPVRDLKR